MADFCFFTQAKKPPNKILPCFVSFGLEPKRGL
jgi:hypothetical protein